MDRAWLYDVEDRGRFMYVCMYVWHYSGVGIKVKKQHCGIQNCV